MECPMWAVQNTIVQMRFAVGGHKKAQCLVGKHCAVDSQWRRGKRLILVLSLDGFKDILHRLYKTTG